MRLFPWKSPRIQVVKKTMKNATILFFFLAVSFHSRSTREPEAKMHKTLRDFLKHEHPDDSVLGFPFREISSKYLLKQILSGELTGFVGFEGGREKNTKR